MLPGIYLNGMPYRDPHTAGPALCRHLLQTAGTAFEVEFLPGCPATRHGGRGS